MIDWEQINRERNEAEERRRAEGAIALERELRSQNETLARQLAVLQDGEWPPLEALLALAPARMELHSESPAALTGEYEASWLDYDEATEDHLPTWHGTGSTRQAAIRAATVALLTDLAPTNLPAGAGEASILAAESLTGRDIALMARALLLIANRAAEPAEARRAVARLPGAFVAAAEADMLAEELLAEGDGDDQR